MKPLKVMWNGKRLKDIYPYATKWQVFKYNVGQLVRKVVKCIILVLLLVAGIMIGSNYLPREVVVQQEVDRTPERFADKIEGLKKDVVSKLFACESAGYTEDQAIIIMDTNNHLSFGQGQFQTRTIIHYYKVLYGKDLTPKEAVLIALDTQKASELAKDIIFLTKNKVSGDWYNCAVKYNLDAQVDMIKKLAQ